MSNSAYLKKYYKENRELIIERSHKRYLLHRKEILAKSKENHIENRERHNESSKRGHYRRKFGLSLEQRDAILMKGCQICHGQATHIDHDHLTGKIRGGLCNNCNTGLGMFKDNQDTLISALCYVSKN